MRWSVLVGFALVTSFGCEAHRSPDDSSQARDLDPNWPPPDFFHFVGYRWPNGAIEQAMGVQVNDRYVYWYQYGGHFERADKLAPALPSEVLYNNATGSYFAFALDGGFLYSLDHASVRRTNEADLTQTVIPLAWDHTSGGGALDIDETYIYTAMPGCAAITRIDKQALTSEVMYIAGVGYPGRGLTYLAKSGDNLVCASPSTLFLIGAWGEAPTVFYAAVHDLFGMVPVGEGAYWVEQQINGNGDTSTFIGFAPFAGGGGLVAGDSQAIAALRLVYAPSINRILYAGLDGVRAFDPQTNTVGALVKTGRANDVAVDAEYAYASVLGQRLHTDKGETRNDSAFWIARIPLAEFAKDPDAGATP